MPPAAHEAIAWRVRTWMRGPGSPGNRKEVRVELGRKGRGPFFWAAACGRFFVGPPRRKPGFFPKQSFSVSFLFTKQRSRVLWRRSQQAALGKPPCARWAVGVCYTRALMCVAAAMGEKARSSRLRGGSREHGAAIGVYYMGKFYSNRTRNIYHRR